MEKERVEFQKKTENQKTEIARVRRDLTEKVAMYEKDGMQKQKTYENKLQQFEKENLDLKHQVKLVTKENLEMQKKMQQSTDDLTDTKHKHQLEIASLQHQLEACKIQEKTDATSNVGKLMEVIQKVDIPFAFKCNIVLFVQSHIYQQCISRYLLLLWKT